MRSRARCCSLLDCECRARGPRLEQRLEGPAPLHIRLPLGARMVWLPEPETGMPDRLREPFRLAHMDPVYFCDLPETSGVWRVGDHLLVG